MKVKNDHDRKKMFQVFKKKYANIDQLIIFKTLEYSTSLGKAFDALEDFTGEFPLTWDSQLEKWVPEVLLEYQFLQDGE